MQPPVIVWFRLDLRLSDNPALAAACAEGGPILPLYVDDPAAEGTWAPGAASRWWLHHSLASLDADLRRRGSQLLVARGSADTVLHTLARKTGAVAVHWNRRYEPAVIARDRRIKEDLRAAGLNAHSHNGALLCEPWEVRTKTGGPYQVFTPFWRACAERLPPPPPLPAPERLEPVPPNLPSLRLEELALLPRIDWAAGMRAAWNPGEAGAKARLADFLERHVARYAHQRDIPGEPWTSRLSPHLHFGEISPRQVWAAVQSAAEWGAAPGAAGSIETYLREIGWREFGYHLLYHFPHTTDLPLRAGFAAFPWQDDADLRHAWQRGRTGYPIVDAGMRELWATGWMHNRVRMIAASFLVKDLLISWRAGAEWFWDTLVDADLASNTLGWQWTAGCGADAAPYFRVFHPVLQGEKFDPHGAYVRRWIPELRGLPDAVVHRPWSADAATLRAAGVELGRDYPLPIVDHGAARARALDAFALSRRHPAASLAREGATP